MRRSWLARLVFGRVRRFLVFPPVMSARGQSRIQEAIAQFRERAKSKGQAAAQPPRADHVH